MRYFLGGLGVRFWNLTPRVPEIHTLTLAYNHVIRFGRPNTWSSKAESREPNTITRQRGDTMMISHIIMLGLGRSWNVRKYLNTSQNLRYNGVSGSA